MNLTPNEQALRNLILSSGSPAAADITDSTVTGRAVLTAVNAAAGRTALGAGTSSLALGTTGTTACAGNDGRLSDARTPTAHTHPASDVSDSTATGRAVLTAASGAAARTAIGAGTSDLALGSTSTTAAAGDHTHAATGLGTNFSNRSLATVAPAQRAFAANNASVWVPIWIPVATTLTGLRYRKGTGTVAANVIGALYNAAGNRVALSGTVAQGTTASVAKDVAFSGTYAAAAGLYWAYLMGSSTSADFYGWTTNEYLGPAGAATQASFAAPSSVTAPATTTLSTSTTVPDICTY